MIRTFTFLILTLVLGAFQAHAQESVSGFEEMQLPVDTFWNGNDSSGGFVSGQSFFYNSYDFTYNYWSGGWAVSTKTDTETAGFTNLYSAITGTGVQSPSYAVGQQNARIVLQEDYKKPRGLWITNTTYAARSMEQGDQFAKKFGGKEGTDPDFFVLHIYGYDGGVKDTAHRVDFYLADFRSDDSLNDYIVKDWRWVDLNSIPRADSLEFVLESSDTSKYGYNTPLFFAIDDLTVDLLSASTDLSQAPSSIHVMPNPAVDYIRVNTPGVSGMLEVFDMNGKGRIAQEVQSGTPLIDVHGLKAGMYTCVLRNTHGAVVGVTRFVKQ